MKIHYNLSENHILEMLHDTEAMFPQWSLNKWMHQIMSCLRKRLLDLMLEVLKESKNTHNDETRILIRNLADENVPSKYKIEYIHAALSMEKKLVVMHSCQTISKACHRADGLPLLPWEIRQVEELYVRATFGFTSMKAAKWTNWTLITKHPKNMSRNVHNA